MSSEKKNSVKNILQGQFNESIERSLLHRTNIHNAYVHGLEEGITKAAGKKSFTDVTLDEIKKYSKEGAQAAVTHLDDKVTNFFLENPNLKVDDELADDLKRAMYTTLFGSEIAIEGPNGKTKGVPDKKYFEQVFESLLSQATGKHRDWGALEATLEDAGVYKSLDQKMKYDFGKGVDLEHAGELFDMTGLNDFYDVGRVKSKQDLNIGLSIAKEFFELGEDKHKELRQNTKYQHKILQIGENLLNSESNERLKALYRDAA